MTYFNLQSFHRHVFKTCLVFIMVVVPFSKALTTVVFQRGNRLLGRFDRELSKSLIKNFARRGSSTRCIQSFGGNICNTYYRQDGKQSRYFHASGLLSAETDNAGEVDSIIEEEEYEDGEEVENLFEHDSTTAYDVILDGLNDAQVQAVTQPLHSVTRVVAGPGAGKTRVLTCRIAYLLKRDDEDPNGVKNSRILAVTFTKKAASEMQHRLESLLKDDEEYQLKMVGEANNVPVDSDDIFEEVVMSDSSTKIGQTSSANMISRVSLGTFHSICSKILRWNGDELDALPSIQHYRSKDQDGPMLDGSFAIIDQSEQMRIVKQCLSDAGIELKGARGQQDIRPITIVNAVGQLKSDDAMNIDGRDPEERPGSIKMTDKVRRIAEEVYPRYRRSLLSQNSVDFDDLILYTRELLKTNEGIRERMSRRWTHILVDEFQDTSEVQLELVQLLTRDSLLIVGDGDQSIYSWRGAHAESMSDFVHKFDTHDKKVDTVYLMENYRSTTNIVKAAQKVINHDSSNTANQAIRQDMKPMRGKGPSPRVLACADAKAEASFVVKEILKMNEEGTLGSSSTVALIYRTNAQSRALEEACVEHNLKYLVRGSAGTFYSRAEIKDCLCFLKWIYNGKDKSAMYRAIKTPSRGLGDVSLNEFDAYCDEVVRQISRQGSNVPIPTPLEILLSFAKLDEEWYLATDGLISKRTMNKLIPFANQMNKIYRMAQSQTVPELIGTIIEVMSLKNHFDAISKTSDDFADRWQNVIELLNSCQRYALDGSCLEKKIVDIGGVAEQEEMSPLANFLDDVSLLTDTEGADSESDADGRLVANLMTIHASKGMEFDAVFLVGNEEATFPTQRSITEGEGSIELAEERRLCYVAMTRAKTYLVMTWRKEVTTFFGQGFKVNKAERSRFLDAIVANKTTKTSTLPSRSASSSNNNNGTFGVVKSRKTKKKVVPQRTPRSATDPLAVPVPKKKKVKKRKVTRASSFQATNDSVKQLLKKKTDDREEAERWKQYHARKATERSTRTPPPRPPPPRASSLPQRRNDSQAGVSSARGRRALSNTTSIRPRGNNANESSRTTSPENSPKRGVTSSRRKPSTSSKESAVPYSPPTESLLDSSLFFPEGSTVKHRVHGDGRVVKGSDIERVHVNFDCGMELDFPVTNNGLTIKY